MLTHIEPQPRMLFVELQHYTRHKVPLFLANAVVADMGEPACRFKNSAHWYGTLAAVDANEGIAERMPFAVAIGVDGDCEIQVRFGDEELLAAGLMSHIRPELIVEVKR